MVDIAGSSMRFFRFPVGWHICGDYFNAEHVAVYVGGGCGFLCLLVCGQGLVGESCLVDFFPDVSFVTGMDAVASFWQNSLLGFYSKKRLRSSDKKIRALIVRNKKK